MDKGALTGHLGQMDRRTGHASIPWHCLGMMIDLIRNPLRTRYDDAWCPAPNRMWDDPHEILEERPEMRDSPNNAETPLKCPSKGFPFDDEAAD
jgi:hypothetical protein